MKFGKLTIIDEEFFKTVTKGMHVKIKVKCDCGTIKFVQNTDLVWRKVSSCGCLTHQHSSNFIDLTNKKFTGLFVTKLDHVENKIVYWLCKCDCGTTVIVQGSSLKNGNTKSCGCLKNNLIAKSKITHGLSRTKFYKIYNGIIQRCTNLNNPKYKDYGGRGITVCDRWRESFENFRDDMYQSYLEHVKEYEGDTSLDRIDVNGNYESLNTRWIRISFQSRNRRDSAISDNYDVHLYWKRKLYLIVYQGLFIGLKKSKIFEQYVGCTPEEFKQHIESKFTSGMAWDNRGQGIDRWELDHIIGVNNFDLSKEDDRLRCYNYVNYQPLWWQDHKKKNIQRIVKVEVMCHR
ncbi:MAG: hypothetical protein ACREBR_05660 [bacterium]